VGQGGWPNIEVSRLSRMIMAVDLYDRFRHANDWAPERVILVDSLLLSPTISLAFTIPCSLYSLIPCVPFISVPHYLTEWHEMIKFQIRAVLYYDACDSPASNLNALF
jgi:hypothetical protein